MNFKTSYFIKKSLVYSISMECSSLKLLKKSRTTCVLFLSNSKQEFAIKK